MNMKRKMFRKLLASLLAASMVVSMTACGNENEESRGAIPPHRLARLLPARHSLRRRLPATLRSLLRKRIWALTPSERMLTATRSIWAESISLFVTGPRIPMPRLPRLLLGMPVTHIGSGCRRPIISLWSRKLSVHGSPFPKISPIM